jgi:electron transfer flavoprotein beta subunit
VPRYSKNDGLALSLALQLADATMAETDVLHAGNADNPALLDYLALGAKKIRVLPGSSDIVPVLAAQLGLADLILTGSRAENGEDSGLLPYLLAEALSRPVVANVLAINITGNGVEVLQFLPKGKRRRICIQQSAIIVIHPLANVVLRYAYARQMSGKITTISDVEQSNIAYSLPFEPARKTVKLKAKETKAGHARMLSAIASESKGGIVVIDGNPVEKAQVVLAYLREHRLIDF